MTAPEMYAQIEAICAPEGVGIAPPGWCTPGKGRWLAEHVLAEHLTHCVEIGVFGGRSLLALGLAVRHLGRGGYVLGVDPYDADRQIEGVSSFTGPGEAEAHTAWTRTIPFDTIHANALALIRALGVQSHCGLLRAASDECAGLIGPIDLLHIDGCHSVLASCRDVEVWVPKVRPGGLIVLDDCEWETVQPARAMLAAQCEPPVSVEPGWEAYRKRCGAP